MNIDLAFIASVAACIAGVILLMLATVELISSSFRFWPPPENEPWKKSAFMILFRVLVYGMVFASALQIWQSGIQSSTIARTLAVILFVCGFAIAFWATGALGWANALGSKKGLRTDGIFAYSRNPVYIATWIGLAGWGLLVPEPIVIATLFCWALLYLVAIFLEERWLEKKYGDSYLRFCRDVRRFF